MFVPHRSRFAAFAALAGLAALTLTPVSTATAATGLATDVVVSGHQTTASSTVVSPVFSTTQSGELLLAFVTADGPAVAGSETFPSVTGAGLTWQLRKRVNAQYGTAEIWQAVSGSVITNATVTATHGGSALAAITVVGFTGADTATAGAVAGASGASGAPSTTLTTTRTGSWVWGVGEDWDNAAARTVGSGQTKVDEDLASSGDTFWTQRQTSVTTAAAPTSVTINDTAPTNDRWNLAAIEVLPANTQDTTPPTVSMSGPADGSTVTGTVAVSATATDNVGVASVQFLLDGAPVGAVVTSSPYTIQWDSTSVANGTHTLSATARDGADNQATAPPVTVTVSNSANDPSVVGSWGPVVPWPEVSIHAALTDTGKVLTWQGDFSANGQQYLLDPVSGDYIQVPNGAVDLFCAGQAVLADGRIAVIGGTATSGGLGITAVNAFDPSTQTWAPLKSMNHPRWYPTGTTLADGRVLVTSGSNTGLTDIVPIPEVYNPPANTWTDLTAASNPIPYYPFMYQLPDGRVLQAGASEQATSTQALDVAKQQWTTIDSQVLDGASITNYAPGKFLKAGTASDGGFTGLSANTAYTLDMNQPNPAWKATASMAYPRSFVDLTNLPDGTVLATGGGTDKSGQDVTKAVKPAEIWNPGTGTWTTVAALTAPRLYHSVALLLPDGRVFVSGGGGDNGVTNQLSYQIYSPPYLFKGARPTITSAPSTVQYGSTAFIQTPDAAGITSVSLIRTGSDTHAFDQNTRGMQLSFTQTAGGLNVQLPPNGNWAPPGYYMLTIVNGKGVPSTAAMVRFPAPYEDTVPPTAPGAPTATGAVGSVTLGWTASTDNVGVTGYDIYRSTTSGFTPSAANLVKQVGGSTTSYTDTGLAAGTYYYQVEAVDAAGNASPPSGEVSGTALADTTPPSAPGNLTASAGAAGIALSWTASTDDVGVVRYNITRNGSPLTTTTGTGYTDAAVVGGTSYTYTVTAQDAAGNVSAASNSATATAVSGPKAITVDKLVTKHQGTAASTVAVGGLTTTGTNELLLAFISSDGGNAAQIGSVSGGGLTWTLRQRANIQAGTAEVWQAVAPTPLSNVTVTATQKSGSWQSSLTVAGFLGADSGAGAVTAANGSSGAPSATLTTTRAGSWVWGVGTDWTAARARTVGAGQTLVDQYLSPSGDTYWLQRTNAPTAAAGTAVTINDTAPTTDLWDLALVEILPAP
ncbi:galactose oxidase-like domain-containing protein [Leifsonia shinshuensis]|uniref:Fibronectin type 3 domain-containing protein n=1 Tax=Leifsonia shinshuensis TaxID=150026 RepID=A0A853CRB4_9MICO|nr:galactose oxidase-like domain-containing protein [Leifsonia shinshuensis]NYJ22021.1 fibronectin type 3 domain-containing protein [Leifsonia shinshuensis]